MKLKHINKTKTVLLIVKLHCAKLDGALVNAEEFTTINENIYSLCIRIVICCNLMCNIYIYIYI
jgi:hypothetical protein